MLEMEALSWAEVISDDIVNVDMCGNVCGSTKNTHTIC